MFPSHPFRVRRIGDLAVACAVTENHLLIFFLLFKCRIIRKTVSLHVTNRELKTSPGRAEPVNGISECFHPHVDVRQT